MAGLKIIWGFDKDQHACTSWKLNFPNAHMYTLMAHEFVQKGEDSDQLKVDIMHLSPPCQVWSPAHTTPGRDDEMNLASLYACGSILKAVKPRIATLEQTFGIVSLSRFQAYFRSLILMFTDNGYSVRWKVALLQNWVCG
jgi:DNA (cytosine-5)-methyltransferase 1